MEHLLYPHKSIATIKSLSGLLQIPEDFLIDVSEKSGTYYKQNTPEIKPNGKKRITYRLNKKLKFVQTRIKNKIFKNVKYPKYLQGSIKDAVNPRTYDGDVRIHANGRFVISEDVSDFFDSISEAQVKNTWKYFFKFSNEVADLLTKLTTYEGFLRQGAVTSSYLANIVLWKIEPPVVNEIENMGFTYTRYVDDINISSKISNIPEEDIQNTIQLVYGMMGKIGVKPNRKKHQIMTKSVPIKIHKLLINSGRPTMSKRRRDKIKSDVFKLKKLSLECKRNGEEYYDEHVSLSGKVRELSKFHANQGKKLNKIMSAIPPLYKPKPRAKKIKAV